MQENAGGNSQVISENIIKGSSHTFTGLEKNNRYIVQLRAIGSQALAPAGGEGTKGGETSVIHDTHPPQPPQPTNPPNRINAEPATTTENLDGDIVDAPRITVTDLVECETDDVTPSTAHNKQDINESVANDNTVKTGHDTATLGKNAVVATPEVELAQAEKTTISSDTDPAPPMIVKADPTDHSSSDLNDQTERIIDQPPSEQLQPDAPKQQAEIDTEK